MKDLLALQRVIPSGSVLLHAEGEGDFVAPAWMHLATGIYGLTCAGHLDDCTSADEGDRIGAFAKALRFVEAAHPQRFLWDMRLLRGIEAPGLKLLKDFHREFSGHTACAMVPNGLKHPVSLVTLLADCYIGDSVADAFAWLETRKNGSG